MQPGDLGAGFVWDGREIFQGDLDVGESYGLEGDLRMAVVGHVQMRGAEPFHC